MPKALQGSSDGAAGDALKMRLTVAPNREAVSTLFGEPAMFWCYQNLLAPFMLSHSWGDF
jgi:hypothetical protein